ncbi:MAG: Glycerol kinase [Peltula sp. TS41687]|nr:MAG: Glycerol kinase [Peltula sp. TS41687]
MASISDDASVNHFIGSMDQGTSSSRFFIFDRMGNPVTSHQVEFGQIHPHPGWHEQDPFEILSSMETCIARATEAFVGQGHKLSDIKAIGLTNQRETTVVWHAKTGEVLYNAIVWTDTRTSSLVRELKERAGASTVPDICGLPLSTYSSAVKLLWMLRNVDAARKAYEEGHLIFGTMDTWLLYNLNGGKDRNFLVTDVTNASRTMFLNLNSLEYDDTLLEFFQLDQERPILPKVAPSSDSNAFGCMASGPLEGTPIMGCLGDQSAALLGQQGFDQGMAKNTYGTGCFLLCNVGDKPVFSKNGLLATVAYDLGAGRKPTYALEGSIAAAGSAVRFLSNNLGFFNRPQEIDELASSVEDSGGVMFVTAFSGLFAPYWIDDAKGTIFGLSHHTQRGHIARACLEATCFQTKAILIAMEKDSGYKMRQLAVDGGMSNSDLCMQIQSDIIGLPVERPAMRETTALGAAIAAGLALGLWKGLDELKELFGKRQDISVFHPSISAQECERIYSRWERAVSMARGWIGQEDVGDGEEDGENDG